MQRTMGKMQKWKLASIFSIWHIGRYMSATSTEPQQSGGEVVCGAHSLIVTKLHAISTSTEPQQSGGEVVCGAHSLAA